MGYDPPMPVNERPATKVDEAAENGLEIIRWSLAHKGREARHILIVIDAEPIAGEPNATVAGYGYEDNRDVLTEILQHALELSKEMGVDLRHLIL